MRSFTLSALSGRLCSLAFLGLLAAPAQAQQAQTDDASVQLETVVVTAGKRAQELKDVADSVSALTGEQLQQMGAQSMADYINHMPGALFNSYQPGVSHVVIRGIATSSGNSQTQPTTGYFINEIPLTEPGWSIVIPDIDAFDLARVEVMRGPQGSLFGSGAMGGAVNFVANEADVSAFDAALETTVSQTRNADVGYTAKGMVNLPLIEGKLAVRGVAEYRMDPGYLDNVGTGVKGSNDTSVSGGRFSAVWTPSDATRLTWLSLIQDTDNDDNAYRMPDVGSLKRDTSISEPTDTSVDLHSLRWDQDMDWATFTALGSWQKKKQDWRMDYTPYLSAYNGDLDIDLQAPLYILSGGDNTGKSLELRLSSPTGGALEWMIGTLYYKTHKYYYEALGAAGADEAFDASSLYGAGSGEVIAPDGSIFNAYHSNTYGKEMALFGEGSWNFAPKWKLTLGGRLFENKQDVDTWTAGFSTYPGDPSTSTASDKDNGFNPKASLSYQANDDLMIYGLVSEGFRFGTPNVQGLSAYAMPSGSKSDSLINYEIGTHSRWLDNRLQMDVTAFYVDWSDIQLRLQTPDYYNYATNGGKAYSRGLELSSSWLLTRQLDWTSAVTWQHARLDEDLDILYYGTAPKGSRLPGSSDWVVNNTLAYQFAGELMPRLSVSHQYISKGLSDMNSSVPGIDPNEQGDYNLFDARLAVTVGSTELTLFGTNLTDKRGVTRTVDEAVGTGQGIVRPRTVGVTAHWDF